MTSTNALKAKADRYNRRSYGFGGEFDTNVKEDGKYIRKIKNYARKALRIEKGGDEGMV